MADFIIEIGTEEIPSNMIPALVGELEDKVRAKLTEKRLPFEAIKKFGAPRRIGLCVWNISEKQPDSDEIMMGPPVSIAMNDKGEWTQASLGFAKKNGLKAEELKVIEGPKGKVVGAEVQVKGRTAEEILAEVIPAAVDSLYLPKSMKWGDGEHEFVRPVRWVLALLDTKVVPMSIKGVEAGNTTRGHRVFGKEGAVVADPTAYFDTLKHEHVIADIEERRKKILRALGDLAESVEGKWHDDKPETEDLLKSVIFLSEFPSVVLGEIPGEFLSLPTPVLSTCLREHQKFFSVYKKGIGSKHEILPYFLAVCDGPRTLGETKTILEGLKNVTIARLQDAKFFYEHDKAVKLEKRLEELKGILYHPKIGTYYEKSRRMERYARELAPFFSIDPDITAKAALLSKCDLASLLIQEKEFTSLQGVAGGLYAESQGEDPRISRAISEHYQPTAGEDGKTSPYSLAVTVADRFDTLIEFFKIKETPTGSKDPFGLRRAGKIVVEILADASLYEGSAKPQVSLEELARRWYGKDCPELLEFLKERLRYFFESAKGPDGKPRFQYDEINAILATPMNNLIDMVERLSALNAVRQEHREDFDALGVAFKRSRNILKGLPSYRLDPAKFLPENSKEGVCERELHKAYIQIKDKAEEDIARGEYRGALRSIATLRPHVDKFYDDVLVMCDPEGKDPQKTAVQQNRLALLERLTKLFYKIADFAEIVPRES